MIDLQRTLKLISGGLFDPEKTWRTYLPEAKNWQKTALLLTGPLIVLAALAAYVFGFLGSDLSMFGRFRPTIVSTLLSIVTGGIAAAVIALVISLLAGAFGGKNSFALGLAATTFAFIPGYLGQAVTWLPWIGGLLSIALSIYGLVLLWKIIPIYLAVPDGKRVGHYILSLVVTIVAMVIISMTVGRFLYPTMGGPSFGGQFDVPRSGSPASGGLYGGIARQAELMSAADEDEYDPPSSGRLSRDQVLEFVRVMRRSEAVEQERLADLKEIAERAENDGDLSFSDLGSMMSGVTSAAGLHTAEIEVVKSAGGNWAEHVWVRESLQRAWLQKDMDDTIEHNYKLYQEYEEELSGYLVNR